MNKPAMLMLICNDQANAMNRLKEWDKLLAPLAKVKIKDSYFFESQQSAFDALKGVSKIMRETDEFFIIPISTDHPAFVHCGDAFFAGFATLGVSTFCVPYVTPGRACEFSVAPPGSQPLS
jgi:hypothetical protein